MPFIFHPLIIHLFVANTAENNKRIAKNMNTHALN